jgi:molybdopterin/thiamine biosynthesis adenylyltransferase
MNRELSDAAQASGKWVWEPLFLLPESSSDADFLKSLQHPSSGWDIVDQYEMQLANWVRIRNPHPQFSAADIHSEVSRELSINPSDKSGVWVLYPWRKTAVHLLNREQFIEVRTSRNQYKITKEEQQKLSNCKIGIIGLSVGQSAALTIAMERLAGEIRIADFDDLELTNLNRIRSSVINLGLPKSVIVAREIAELDPFIRVKVYDEGIHEGNLESFLSESGDLNLLIEECDNPVMKILSRIAAKKKRIPVVMDTSDRCMLDIERFDLDAEYPVLHGAIENESITADEIKALGAQLLMKVVDIHAISDGMKRSLPEIGKSITTWPQLASEVTTGAGIAAAAARHILLGKAVASGRYYFDPESKF